MAPRPETVYQGVYVVAAERVLYITSSFSVVGDHSPGRRDMARYGARTGMDGHEALLRFVGDRSPPSSTFAFITHSLQKPKLVDPSNRSEDGYKRVQGSRQRQRQQISLQASQRDLDHVTETTNTSTLPIRLAFKA